MRTLYKVPGLVWLYHFLWAFFGALIYSFPGRRIFVIGVTGTKGKTTTLELLGAILEAAGKKTAILSSLRVKIGSESEKNKFGNTMPGRFYIQRFLSRAIRAGCKYALVEVTSQGVVMHRHRFIDWNAGILMGLHPEHIESHGSFEKYRSAKLNFLKYVLRKRGKVFINGDDENAEFFLVSLRATEGRVAIPWKDEIASASPRNDVNENVTVYSKNDKNITAAFPGDLPLRGAIDEHDFVRSDFNKDNMAAAVAVALDLGVGIKTIEEALRGFRGVPGRMEFIRRGGITAVVDYAHTPDSLRKVYSFLRESNSKFQIPNSKLICVLGSAGGGRDKWKRPELGKIAAEYCDEIILTEDDSYDEKPETIIEEIAAGFSEIPNSRFHVPNSYYKIVDRREAIQKAIELAREGDIVVCTGIGSQDVIHRAKGKKNPWSERAVVEEALKDKQGYN